MTVYLDCNATSPIEPRVADIVERYLREEFGNAGSRTHDFGSRAKRAVVGAREAVAAVANSQPDEVIFTSGATEANNLAILGLATALDASGRRHILASGIEHKAVLEPLALLERRGYEVTLISPDASGRVDPVEFMRHLRPETGLVSLMHANNETGVLQPVAEVAEALGEHDAYFHVDAAQTFGKEVEDLRRQRIDLVSVSAHKLYGPKGVGALIARRRGFQRVPLEPLMVGGGQERGLRPGTLPVALICGLGEAARIALAEAADRRTKNQQTRVTALAALSAIGAVQNGEERWTLPHVLNVSIPGVDSEAVMVALKDLVAISNGSACTSQSYDLSHVLVAMGLPDDRIRGALRISWCHMTPPIPWEAVCQAIQQLAA